MATIAVFISLGAGAYAISRNDVKSKHIAPGAVKLSDTSTKLRLKCPAATLFVEGACLERTERGEAAWFAAQGDCADERRRLPSPAELMSGRLEAAIDLGDGTWTDDAGEWINAGDFQLVSLIGEGGDHQLANIDDAHPYRCAAPPRR